MDMDMDIDMDLDYLECVGTNRDRHFLETPVLLQCGHFMCSGCINNEQNGSDNEQNGSDNEQNGSDNEQNGSDNEKNGSDNEENESDNEEIGSDSEENGSDVVKCGLCKEDKTVNLKMNQATLVMNKQIEACLGRLFDVVQHKCKTTLAKLKGTYMETKESIEAQFEYVKEEIEIRAESLKNEIDELCKTIYSDLQVQKELNLKKLDAIHNEVCNCENDLENKQDLKFVEKETENLANIQGKLEMLKKLNQDLLNENINKIRSITTQRSIDMELITYLEHSDKNHKSLKIPTMFKQTIPIDVRGLHLCVIPGDQLIVSDSLNKCILVLDKDMKPVKTVNEINGNSFKPFATSTNGIDRIFISDIQIKKILMTDLDFKLMATFESNDLIYPCGLCYSNDLLYVCSYKSQSIHVIEQDFTNKTSYELDFKPWYIQVIDNIACVRHYHEKCISFYKLPEFKLKYRYESHNGFICVVDSKFYEYYQPISTFYCYNSDGTICFKQKNELKNGKVLDIFDPIVYFKDKFILSSNSSKELIK